MSALVRETEEIIPAPSSFEKMKMDQKKALNRGLNKPSLVGLRLLTIVIFGLVLTQYTYGIIGHSSLISIQFAASVLALLSSIEVFASIIPKKFTPSGPSVFLLYRTAGTVFFIACLFLNLTHCLEEISDLNVHTDDVVGNETTTVEPEKEQGHEHHVAHATLYISIADLVIKSIFALAYNALTIHFIGNFIALASPSAVTILVYHYNAYEMNYFFDWLDHHVEPVTSILLTIVCLSIAIYSLIRKKQFLLAEGPRGFSIDKISNAVKSKNGKLEKVDHVHASCEWPEGFTVSLKAYVKVEKNNKDWVARAATDFSELKTLLHTEIKAQGATEVIVEPVFVDRNEVTVADPICIDSSCHNQSFGCCTIPEAVNQEVLA